MKAKSGRRLIKTINWHLLFRNSSYILLANKFRVYHLPTRKSAVNLALYVLLLSEKNIRSLKKSMRVIFYTITHLLFLQNFRKKWAKQLTPVKRSTLFTPSKFGRVGRLQPRVLSDCIYGHGATLKD